MTTELSDIKKLLEIVISQGVHLTLWSYVALALITIAAAFVGAYVKKRGENYATKQDFESILGQVRQVTQTTEDIKAAVLKAQTLEEWRREDMVRFHDERKKLYARVLAYTDQARSAFEKAFAFEQEYRSDSSHSKEWREEKLNAEEEADASGLTVLVDLGALYREISLISSSDVIQAASGLIEELQRFTREHRWLTSLLGEDNWRGPISSTEKIHAAQDRFVNAARQELGIEEGGVRNLF